MPKQNDGKPTDEWETVNSASALWTRPKSELKDEDYQNFYKSLSHDFNDALAWTHNRVEGNQNFTSAAVRAGEGAVRFHELAATSARASSSTSVASSSWTPASSCCRRICASCAASSIPMTCRSMSVAKSFSRIARSSASRGACTKRVLDLLDKLAKDEPEKYATFWRAFGSVLKEGIAEDTGNRERIAKLLRFASTRSEGPAPDRFAG